MKRRRHTPEQIVRKLREADRMIGQGASIAEVLQHLEVTEATYNRPRKALGWKTPAEVFDEQLRSLQQPGVASTG